MVNARMLKELQALAPWTWDKKCEKHPPGTKSLHDFERVEHYSRWPQPPPESSKKSGRSIPKAEDPRPIKKHKGELQDPNQTPGSPGFPPRAPVAMTATPEPSTVDTRAAPPSSLRPSSASSSYSSGPAGSSVGRPAMTPGIAMSTPRSIAHMTPAQREAVMPRRLSLSELPNKDPKAPSPQQQQQAEAAPPMPAPARKQQKVKITMAPPPQPLQPKRQQCLEAPRGVEEAAKTQPLPQKQEPSSMPAPAQKQQKPKIAMAAPPKPLQQGPEAPQGTKKQQQQQQQRRATPAANSTCSAQVAPPGTGSGVKESSSKAPKAPPAPCVRNGPAPPATAAAAAKKITSDIARAEGPAEPAAQVPSKKKPSHPSALPVSAGSTKARKEAAPADTATAAVKKSSGGTLRPDGKKRIITVGGRGASFSASVSTSAAGTSATGTIAKKPPSSGAPACKIITFSGAAPVPEKPAARPQPSLIRSSIPPLFVTPAAALQQQPSSGSTATAAPQRASKGPAAAEMPPPPPVRPSGKARVAPQVESKQHQRPPVAALGPLAASSPGPCSSGEGEKEGKAAGLARAGKDGGLLSKASLAEAPSATSNPPPRPADALRDITNSSPGAKQGIAWPLFVQRQPPSEKNLIGHEAACSSNSHDDDAEQGEEHVPLHSAWTAEPPAPTSKMAVTAFSTEKWPKTVPHPIERPQTMKRVFAALRMLDARESWMY